MRKVFESLFNRWWIPLIFFILAVLIHVYLGFNSMWKLYEISFYVLLLGWTGLFISIIHLILKRNWIKAILIAVVFSAAIPAYSYYGIVMFWFDQSSTDTFADDLVIPKDIIIHPLASVDFDGNRPDSILNIPRTKADFELYRSFQPGLFQYDFWTTRIDSGIIYLKAFEVTQNTPLSADRLEMTSSINVFNQTDSVLRFGVKGIVTIYEGDWGKPYAARFEVWFKESNEARGKKLMEKIYIIEGWER